MSWKCTIILILGISLNAGANNGYTVPAGATQLINEHNECRQVQNSGAHSVFIPTKSSAEWSSARSGQVPGVNFLTCTCNFHGTIVNIGDSVTAWNLANENSATPCRSEPRVCQPDQTFTGSYNFTSCTASPPAQGPAPGPTSTPTDSGGCHFNSVNLLPGASMTMWNRASGTSAEPCLSEVRVCQFGGTMTGSYGFSSCTAAPTTTWWHWGDCYFDESGGGTCPVHTPCPQSAPFGLACSPAGMMCVNSTPSDASVVVMVYECR